MAGNGAAKAQGNRSDKSATKGGRESGQENIRVWFYLSNGYREHLSDVGKLKDIEKKQEQLSKELEMQDIKAHHYEYMAVSDYVQE